MYTYYIIDADTVQSFQKNEKVYNLYTITTKRRY